MRDGIVPSLFGRHEYLLSIKFLEEMMMLKKLFILLGLSLPLAFTGAALADELQFEVHGMACSFCAYGLEKKVKKMDGVEEVKVNVQTGIATIKVKDGATLDRDKLREVVKDSGLKMEGEKMIRSETPEGS